MRRYLREILDILDAERRKLPLLFLLFLGSSLLDFVGIGLIGPYVALVMDPRVLQGRLGDLISAIGAPREQQAALMVFGLVLTAIFVLKAAAGIGVHAAIIAYSQRQQVRLQASLMGAYQRLPYTDFLRRNSSEYVYAIESLTGTFANVVRLVLRTLSDLIVALSLLALLAWQNAPALVLLASLLLALIYGYDRLFRRNLRVYGEHTNRAGIRMVQGIHEGMEGFKEIRILGKEDHFHRMVENGAAQYARYSLLAQLITLAPRYLIEAAMVAFVVVLVFLVLSLGQDIEALVPTLGVFGVAALRLMPAASTFSSSLIQLRYSRDSVARLHQDFAELSGVRLEPRAPDAAGRGEPFESLVLDRLTFTYPHAGVAALKDLSMGIRAGDSIGLIGASGSGKTTLVDVLLGLLAPQHGELRYNGRPLSRALAEWRAQVAYLPQQVFLIDDTLRRNVALGVEDDQVDEARLREAVRQARLAEVAEQLPQGLDTMIGERGVRLSGGQRQRVALARAFYHGREVLVMDEATSALDEETEREIVDEIRGLKGRKTVIVIAHRLTTVQHCDRIYRLMEGRIVEQGTYNEVIGSGDR